MNQVICDNIKVATNVLTTVVGERLSTASDIAGQLDIFLKESPSIQKFLDLPINDPQESVLKKLFAKAIIVADEKGMLPFHLPPTMTAESIASTIDESLTRIKTAYLTDEGQINPVKATETLVDHMAAKTMVAAENLVEAGMPKLVDAACNMMVSDFPETVVLVHFIKAVEPKLTPIVKEAVKSGISYLGNMVKNVAKKSVSYVMEKAKQLTK